MPQQNEQITFSPPGDQIDEAELMTLHVPLGYRDLFGVVWEAFHQSASGKGKDRHASDKPFAEQPILQIAREFGTGFTMGQADKKLGEANRMVTRGNRGHAIQELLGTIVYVAATVIALREDE